MPQLTKRAFLAGGACACCGAAFADVTGPGDFGAAGLPTALELGTQPMARIGESLWVGSLAPNVRLHTSTATIAPGVGFPANGLIVESQDGSLLIDTCYTPAQAELLVEWAKQNLQSPILLAVATHFHNDRTGGIEGLKRHGIRTVASPFTCKLARDHGTPVPEPLADFAARPYALRRDCELFFPGPGHTRDNIVVWIGAQKVLFGGCFLKSTTSPTLGNVKDALVSAWAGSIAAMRRQYPSPRIVVPGHGAVGGDPVYWTEALIAKTKG